MHYQQTPQLLTVSTIFENVEALPHSILFFRAFEQWIGGLGVIVIVLRFITPGSISSTLYQSEGRDEKLKPSIKMTIRETLKIYLAYTIFGIILYVLAGMRLFDDTERNVSDFRITGQLIRIGSV